MPEQPIFSLELTDDQWNAYTDRVETLIAARKQSGTLLSAFDLLAGAALLFAVTGNMNKMPAAWVFAAADDSLPDGLLDVAAHIDQRVSDATYALGQFDELCEEVDNLRQSVKAIQAHAKKTIRNVERDADRDNRVVFKDVPKKNADVKA